MRSVSSSIRPIVLENDAAGVATIERVCFDARWSTQDFENFLRPSKAIGFVAQLDGDVAGYVLAEVRADALGKERIQLVRIAVHPRYQQRGLGSRLVRMLKTWLRGDEEALPHQRNRERILCEVAEPNTAAQMFLKHNGFMAVSVSRHFFADGTGAIGMEFRLPPRQSALDFFNWRRVMQR
jgi:ribosomal protein S18 acetylase RimI-like enzyme